MKRGVVPEYLHGSNFFLSLAHEDDTEIEIPEWCFKREPVVNSCADLRHLLSTVRFWGLKEIPPSCIQFMIENFDEKVLSVLLDFADSFYLHKFMSYRPKNTGFKTDDLDNTGCKIEWAVQCGAIEVLRYYHSQGTLFDEYTLKIALMENKFECFKYIFAVTNKFPLGFSECAAESGKLDFLRFGHENGAPWDNALSCAVMYRSLPCVKYALENGCPGIDCAVRVAAQCDHISMLKLLLDFDNGATLFPKLASYAARSSIRCLRFVHERGYHMDSTVLEEAGRRGSLECLQYAREHGCEWTEEVARLAVECGTVECFQIAEQDGCPLPPGLVELAARRERIEHLKYFFAHNPERSLQVSLAAAGHEMDRSLRFVHSQGCPVDIDVMRRAARTGGLSSLDYLHKEVQIPWDESVTAAGATGGHMVIMRYLHENGCPWDSNTCRAAALAGTLDCLKYACQNGCEYAELFQIPSASFLPRIQQYVAELKQGNA